MSDRDFGLDALRAGAILSVILHHVARFGGPRIVLPFGLASIFDRGWAGVDLFFVL
jgi:peptidoglycan/LPS O-acetylase OafA/YrhL